MLWHTKYEARSLSKSVIEADLECSSTTEVHFSTARIASNDRKFVGTGKEENLISDMDSLHASFVFTVPRSPNTMS